MSFTTLDPAPLPMSNGDGFTSARQKSFDLYAEECKQLLALATAVIAFTVTFSKDFAPHASTGLRWLAVAAWGALLFSIVGGIFRLDALAGTLDPGADNVETPTIWAENIQNTSKWQHAFFGIGLALTVLYGGCALFESKQTTQNSALGSAVLADTAKRGGRIGLDTPLSEPADPLEQAANDTTSSESADTLKQKR